MWKSMWNLTLFYAVLRLYTYEITDLDLSTKTNHFREELSQNRKAYEGSVLG